MNLAFGSIGTEVRQIQEFLNPRIQIIRKSGYGHHA